MHIILGVLGSVITILVLLNRLAEAGIDLGGLNPFLWHRRRKWKKTLERDPLFTLDKPMDVAALLIVATAKVDGDISSEEKQAILNIFKDEFHLSVREAADLFGGSAYLLRARTDLGSQVERIIAPCAERFTPEQAASTIDLMAAVAAIDGPGSELREQLIAQARAAFQKLGSKQKWDPA